MDKGILDFWVYWRLIIPGVVTGYFSWCRNRQRKSKNSFPKFCFWSYLVRMHQDKYHQLSICLRYFGFEMYLLAHHPKFAPPNCDCFRSHRTFVGDLCLHGTYVSFPRLLSYPRGLAVELAFQCLHTDVLFVALGFLLPILYSLSLTEVCPCSSGLTRITTSVIGTCPVRRRFGPFDFDIWPFPPYWSALLLGMTPTNI